MYTKKDVTSIIFSSIDHLDQGQKRKSKWQNILQLKYINAISLHALGSITENICQWVFIGGRERGVHSLRKTLMKVQKAAFSTTT